LQLDGEHVCAVRDLGRVVLRRRAVGEIGADPDGEPHGREDAGHHGDEEPPPQRAHCETAL
jgi:hypothetical protein